MPIAYGSPGAISFLESLPMMAGADPGMPALGSGIHPAGYVPAG